MPGLIINGLEVPVPGRKVINYQDDPRVRLAIGEDGMKRSPRLWWSGIRRIILHTTRGIPGGKDQRAQEIRPGAGPPTWHRLNIAEMWKRDDVYSGAHLVVDHDSTSYCLADLRREAAYHATTDNAYSIGVEIKQGGAGELYADQLEAAADVVDVITLFVGIQRQIPALYRGRPIQRLSEVGGCGRDVVGVFGHRDQTHRRGAGDPGDAIFEVLRRRGYEPWDFDAGDDLRAWKARQTKLGVLPDGVPGGATTASLRARGYAGGLWSCAPSP